MDEEYSFFCVYFPRNNTFLALTPIPLPFTSVLLQDAEYIAAAKRVENLGKLESWYFLHHDISSWPEKFKVPLVLAVYNYSLQYLSERTTHEGFTLHAHRIATL
jgi:hypothetical protein